MADVKWTRKEIALGGRLITYLDPILIGENFSSLINLRYTDVGIKGIGGMTKYNPSALTTHPKIRNAFHFVKEQPAESHFLVQAYNDAETESKVFENTTAITNQGNFSATALHTDAVGASLGRFSKGPNGSVIYCNGKESMIWGGNEYRCAAFINYDPSGSFSYDYSDVISNTLDDNENIATLYTGAGGVDSNVMLMLHCNGTDGSTTFTDDSPTTPHTVTANGNAQIDTAQKKFGSASGLFDGTGDYLTIPDNADFDFSGGNFTIDMQVRLNSLSSNMGLYSQSSAGGAGAEEHFQFYVTSAGALVLSIYSAGTEVVNVSTADGTISTGAWYHVELVESGNDWYIFVDGKQKAYTSDTDRAANYTGSVYIGCLVTDQTTTSAYLDGWLDEIRVSNIARHTSEFEAPTQEYSTTTSQSFCYIGSTRPIQGFKLYIKTVNTASSNMGVKYWDGSSWVGVTNFSDGTKSGGVSLAQTGSVTFDSTDGIAKVRFLNDDVLYWYQVYVDNVASGTSIYYITVDTPFQDIKDLWDGVYREPILFKFWDDSNGKFLDFTPNVAEEDYNSGSSTTYAQVGGLQSSTDYIVVGFTEKITGLKFTLPDVANTVTASWITVYYWSGSSWVSVGTVNDGTLNGTKSLGQSGVIDWNPTVGTNEVKRQIEDSPPLYCYKLTFANNFSSDVRIDYCGGITAPETIKGYKFSLFAGNRVWLCSETAGKKNSVRCSSEYTTEVWNGDDTEEFEFGDEREIVAAAGLYTQFGSNLYSVILFAKEHEIWLLIGNDPEDWVKYRLSDSIGCIAPLTLQAVHLGVDKKTGQSKNAVIFQGSNGIYLCDGRSIVGIHSDIQDKFDMRNSNSVNSAKKNISKAFYDEMNQEYHWLCATGTSTTLNEEWVYDIKRGKWYQVDRGSNRALSCGCIAYDTDGNTYNYAAGGDTGYVFRLEYGNKMDEADIDHTFEIGDLALNNGSLEVETIVRRIKLIMVAKTNTSNSVTVTHYGDSKTSGTSFTMSPVKSGYRIADPNKGHSFGPHITHRFKFQISTNNETWGFEPLYLTLLYKPVRLDY